MVANKIMGPIDLKAAACLILLSITGTIPIRIEKEVKVRPSVIPISVTRL
jgi:hypothetical protein